MNDYGYKCIIFYVLSHVHEEASMVDAAKAELVRKAMHDAGLDADRVSAFDEANLLKLHAKGYMTSIALKSAREQDLRDCGIPRGLISVLFQGKRRSL